MAAAAVDAGELASNPMRMQLVDLDAASIPVVFRGMVSMLHV